MSDKKFNKGLFIFILLVVLVGGYTVTSYLKPELFSFSVKDVSSKTGKTVEKAKSKKYIATVYVEGVIESGNNTYNQNWLLSTIDNLRKDKNNVGIALYINSPGGGVYESDEVYLALQDYRTAGKKVYAYMGPLAASGGYYISCAAEEVYANRNTLTGSIGVISGQSFDLTGMFDKLGIKSETIHAGKNKNMGNYNEPLTNEQRQILQSVADECYEQFTGIVAKARNMSVADVKILADGRIYTAQQALDNGLIDHIDNWNNFIEALKTATNGDDTSIKEYRYEHKQTFKEVLLGSASDLATKQAAAKLGLPEKVLKDMNGFSSYPAYLYQ